MHTIPVVEDDWDHLLIYIGVQRSTKATLEEALVHDTWCMAVTSDAAPVFTG